MKLFTLSIGCILAAMILWALAAQGAVYEVDMYTAPNDKDAKIKKVLKVTS